MKKDCTDCYYAKWGERKSGYRRIDKGGECGYPEIPLPHSYLDVYRNMPRRRMVTKHTRRGCPMWEKREEVGGLDFGIKTVNKQLEKVNYIRKKLWEL